MLLVSTVAMAQPELHVVEGFVQHFGYAGGEPIASVSIGDSTVADVLPLTEHDFLIQSHKIGRTNMLFLDKNRQVLDEVIVIVDRPISGLTRIHNKALINSYTEFSCSPTGCQFVGENTVTEPAPLPRGHSEQIFQGNYHHDGTGQTAPLPVPTVVEPR
jgi:hypothetical protein